MIGDSAKGKVLTDSKTEAKPTGSYTIIARGGGGKQSAHKRKPSTFGKMTRNRVLSPATLSTTTSGTSQHLDCRQSASIVNCRARDAQAVWALRYLQSCLDAWCATGFG